MDESSAITESTPTPATQPSIKPVERRNCIPAEFVNKPGGKKFDTSKVRTDLLPMGAVHEAARCLDGLPSILHDPWGTIQTSLAEWRRGSCLSMSEVAAALLVLLTRELQGEIRITSLLPDCGPALLAVAKVLTFGASKYGANNWQGLEQATERYYAALLRHVFAYGSGETVDPESGLPHLAHAACCALFLVSFEVGHDPT